MIDPVERRAWQVQRATRQLGRYGTRLPAKLAQAAVLRVRYPQDSYAQLVRRARVPVPTLSGNLNRLYEWRPPPPRRPRPQVAQPHLAAANQARHTRGTDRTVEAARRALERFDGQLTPAMRAAAKLRLQYPQVTLAELAGLAEPPVTKDVIAGLLRRISSIVQRGSNGARQLP